MQLMNTTPARAPAASMRHASPPGPAPRPGVPRVGTRTTSASGTGARPVVLTDRGFGVGRSGRRRFAGFFFGVGLLAFIKGSEATFELLVGLLPVFGGKEPWRVGDYDVLDSRSDVRGAQCACEFVDLRSYLGA